MSGIGVAGFALVGDTPEVGSGIVDLGAIQPYVTKNVIKNNVKDAVATHSIIVGGTKESVL
jgi:hypothetical protein